MTCLDHDRLHALLDGALTPDDARSAERHLAECAACQTERDAVARLRDAATAILSLGRVAPRRMPPFAVLAARAAAAPVAIPADREIQATVVVPITASAGARGRPGWRHVAPLAAAACVGLVVVYATRAGESAPAADVTSAGTARPAAAPAEPRVAAPQVGVAAAPVTSGRADAASAREPLFLPLRVSFSSGAPSRRGDALAGSTLESPAARASAEPATATDGPPTAAPAAPPRETEPAVAIVPLDAGASRATVATDDDWAAHLAGESEEDGLPAVAPAPPARAATAAEPSAGTVTRASVTAPAAGDSIRARIRRSLQRPVTVRSASVP